MNDQINTTEVEALFKLGAHLGHKKNRLHPKAKKFVYKMVDGVSIIDLTQTVPLLEKAKAALADASKDQKQILVVATKKVANQFTATLCKDLGVPHITSKWMPGLLTNFPTLNKNVSKLREMITQQQNGDWEKFVKHERFAMAKELTRLMKLYGGLLEMNKMPDYLLIIDIKKEKNALIEAKKYNIPVIAIVDTNSNPGDVDYPIVANDDSPAVVEYIMTQLIHSYSKPGAKKAEKVEKEVKKTEEAPATEKTEKKVAAKEETKTEKKVEKVEEKKTVKKPVKAAAIPKAKAKK